MADAPRPPRPGRAWWLLLAATAGYAAFLAFVLFEPSNDVPSRSIAAISRRLAAEGLPRVVSDFSYVDFWCNLAIMLPFAGALVLLWPRVAWERWVVAEFALAAGVEITQAVALPHRVPAFSDVVANTTGVLLGAGATAVALRLARRMRRSRRAATR